MGDSKNIKRTTSSGMEPGKVNMIDPVAIACKRISPKRFTNKANIYICLLIFFLLVLSAQPAYSSGIGFLDYRGEVTISNSYLRWNFIGILATTTNAASIANNTIDNIQIDNNNIYDSLRHGIKIDLFNTGEITIENNLLDNSLVPDTGPDTVNGRFGIRIQNHPSPSIANNTIRNFGRSGIQLLSITNISVANNVLFSNGSQGYNTMINGETRHFGSGLQALDSVFTFVVSNTITSNRFSGIADNLSTGTIGPNNIIMYNGDPSLGVGGGGGVTNCVIAAGGGGLIRGGVLAFNLPSANDTLSICNNNISNNYSLNVGHNGIGSVYSCNNKVVPFFATADDTIFYFDGSSGHVELDCLDPGLLYSDRVDGNATINAKDRPFGIIIEGEASDVTVTNCTIKNAAMNDASRATTGNGSIIGAGIFIANNAEPSISNNYLFSNGWDLLEDRIYTEAGASGIQMRCAGADTKIFSNTFEANASDGMVLRESGGFIGESGRGNIFLNNGRGGIGIYDGTIHNLEIAYNDMHSNQRGIGVLAFDGNLLNITQNRIYSNQNTTSSTGGINFIDLTSAGTVSITNNTLTNNSGWKSGGIGLINSSLTIVDFNIFSNTVSNNAQSGIGILSAQSFTIRNNLIYSNGGAGFSIGTEVYASGIQLRDSSLTNESIVDNTIHSNKFAGIAAYNVRGTVGRSGSSANDIKFNGDPDGSGGLCAGVGGNGRGGISARGLTEDLYVEDPSYIVTSNYTKTVQLRPGSAADLYYNGQKTSSSFWTSDDVALEIAGDITYDCVEQNTKIRGGKIWGITVVGDYTATIQNCSIYNNCTNGDYCDGDMGGGVLIAGGANVYMDNNIVFSNGYGAQVIGLGKCAGVAVRCAGDNTTLVNNTIENNLNDGLVVYDTNGYIGISGAENTIRNNGRHGIGLNSFDGGTSDGPVIAYNRIYSNTAFGIGSYSLTNMNATILNNTIYSNHVTNALGPGGTDIGGGIGLVKFLSLAKIEGNTVRNNSGAKVGGIGVTASNGTVSIVNNRIVSNSAPSGPGGIGIMDSNVIAYIGGNTITDNQVNTSTFYPAGIGVLAPTGGTVIINDNVIASNVSPTDSHVGGVALTGNSAGDRGVLSNVYITSNRISNHRFGAVGNQGAIAFRWMDFSTMFIRNNNKDGLGLSNNGAGIRFHSLADGVDVSIQNNIIRDNITPAASGGAGIEFMNTNYIDVDMDSNIISNCGWKTPGNGDNKAIIAFQNCNLYSSNYVQLRSNQINSSNAHGVQFTAMNGVVAGGHVAKIYIGTDLESPGASNNIINLPAEMRAIEFRYNDTGDIGVEIKNNNNLEGGIALSDNKLYYLTITGNTNIFSGQKGTDADAFYAGIQARNNVVGLRGSGPSNLMPITISDNGIRDNRHNGMMLIAEPVYCDLSMANNTVEDNGRSGMSISMANVVTIVNNTIVSNGLENFNANGLYDASGIRAKDSTLINVTGNTIRNNLFSGIAAYNSGGTIGNDSPPQENLITQNGNPDYPHLCEGIGNGRGGISARDLTDDLFVYDEDLIVTDNYHDNNNSKPGMAVGSLYYNDEIVENDYFDEGDAMYYYNSFEDGVINTTLDCSDPKWGLTNNTIDANGKAFGVTIIGPEAAVTVKNCTIKNAAYSYNMLRPAIEDKVVGAGIWVAANADAYIDNNYLVNNGLDLTRGRFADGTGGTTNNLNNFFWSGGGATDEVGTNQLWVSLANVTNDQIIYLYAGNPDAPAVWNGNTPIKKTFHEIDQIGNETGLISLWQFDGSNCNDVVGANEGTCQGIGFYNNDFRFFAGLIWQNMRGNGRKMMQVEETNGEYGYVEITDGSPSLNLTQAQTIVLWFSQGPGPLYTRKSATGPGGMELTSTGNGEIKLKIENSSGQIYSAISPTDSFELDNRAASQYVAAVYEGAGGKMKLYLQNTLVASTDVPGGFGDIYYNSAKSYIGAMDTDQDAQIEPLWGETFYGLLDEVGIYNLALTPMRVESLFYMRNLGSYEAAGQTSWPTVTVGDPEPGPWTVDTYEWPTRWPVTIGNVLTTLTGFQVGPIQVESPDSGGILMRCVDEGTTVVNNTLTSNARDGISGYSMNSTRIGENSCRNNERFGFGMTSTVTNVRIYSNVVHDNDRGIGGRLVYKGIAPFTIKNNTLRNNDNSPSGWKRFEISFSTSNAWVMIDDNLMDAGNKGIGFQNNDPGLDVTIRNNSIMNLTQQPIRFEKNDPPATFFIENNYINSNVKPITIRFNSAANVSFLTNTIKNTKLSGFSGLDPGNITFDGNTFENTNWHPSNTNTTYSALRFQFLSAGDVADIKNNTFINNGKSGISLQECNGSAVSITNNYIYNSNWRDMGSQAAIRFQLNEDLSTVFIDNNNLFSNNSPGIMFAENEGTSVTVSNNDITYNRRNGAGRGIAFQDNILGTSSGSTSYITVSNNTVEYNDDGIMFRENYDLNDVFISSNDVNYNLDTGVWLFGTENVRLEGNNILDNPNIGLRIKNCSPLIGPTDSYIFSFQRAACFNGVKQYAMADIFNTGMPYNDTDECSGRGWFAAEFKADEPRLNTVRYGDSWGVQVRGEPYDATASIDGDTASEWKTAPSDTTLGSASHTHHSITYDLNMVETVNTVRIYAKRRMSFWDVYFSTNGTDWTTMVSNWAVGGFMTPQWYETSFTGTDARYIKLESEGGDDGKIWRDFFEFEYYTAVEPYSVTTCDGDGSFTLDEEYSTQWSTSETTTPHYIYYDLGFSRQLTSVGIYGGAEELSWNVYVSNNTTSWGSAKITDWAVGGRAADPEKEGGLGDQTSLGSTQVRLDSGAAYDADEYNDMTLLLTGYKTDGVLGDQTSLGSTQVRLDSADASPDIDVYNDMTLVLTSGSGAPVEVTITDYTGSPDYLCTVSPGYTTHPATSDGYRIYSGYPVSVTITDYSGSPDYLCTVSPGYTTHPVEDDSYAIYPDGGVGAALSGYLYTADISATGRYIKLESDGGADDKILDDFYEFQYWSTEEGGGGNIEAVCSIESDDEDSGLTKGNDGNTSTQWRTHPGDLGHATHWISFDLGSDVSNINGVRIYTGTGTHPWDVYVTRSVITPVPVGDRVADDWSAGGSSGWKQTTFSAKTGRYIRWETPGRVQIKDYFYEVQYTTNGGSSWITPPGVTGDGYASINASGPMACSWARKFAMTPVFTGGQYRGNSSTQIGIRGANTDAYLYGLHMGGGAESVSSADKAMVFWENSNSHGNNTVQCRANSTMHIRSGSWINQKTRTESGSHLWFIDNNFASAINCFNAGGGCPAYCGGGGGTTHVIDNNNIPGHTGSIGSTHVIFNGYNEMHGLSACGGGTMDFIDGNHASLINFWYCGEGRVINEPNCNRLTPIGYHPTGSCCCTYSGTCPY